MNFKRGDRVVVNGEQDGAFFRDEIGVVKEVMVASRSCEIQFDDWFGGWGDHHCHWNVAEEHISFWEEENNPPDISIKLETLFET